MTCEVDAKTDASGYDIWIVPHWDVRSAAIESAPSTLAALRRHAEIALTLREAGWEVATRV